MANNSKCRFVPSKRMSGKILTFCIHLVCISLLFVVPEVLASLSRRNFSATFSFAPYFKSIIWVSAFYISYFLTTDPTSGRRSDVVKFIIQDLLILIGATLAMYFFWEYMRPAFKGPLHPGAIAGIPAPKRHYGLSASFIMRDAVVTILTLGLALSLKIARKLRAMEKSRRESLAREREAELQHLKAQLNPHFLFNTLNSIYVLTDIDPAKAKDAIHRLSKMLRYMLYENQGSVILGDEIRFLESYVELMRLRLSPSFVTDIRLNAGDCENNPIAPLLFINILENAFKHGTRSSATGPLLIHLTAAGGTVTLRTANPYDPALSPAENGGIGLANLRRRLELQYPGRHSLDVEMAAGSYNVTLTIDISTPPVMSPNPDISL